MTAKKKRLLFMVLGVCLCVLLAVVIGDFAILENRKENVEKLNQFNGSPACNCRCNLFFLR